MLRTVLAVALATALLATALPVVDSARTTHAERTVENELRHLDSAARRLADASDPVPRDAPGARREHAVVLPQATWGTAPIGALRVPPPGSDEVISYRVAGGNWTTFHTRSPVPVVGPPGGLTLRDGGRHRFVLTFQRRAGAAVVVVSRPDV